MKFWKKLGTTAAIALVFGLVAGLCFSGVSYFFTRRTDSADNVTRIEDVGSERNEKIDESTKDNEVNASGTLTQLVSTGNVSDIVEEVMPAVVAITNVSVVEYRSMWYGSQEYESKSAGSGTIVSEDDDYIYIVTNNHVVKGANTITVTFVNDEACEAVVRGASSTLDIAVVTVDKSDISSDTKGAIRVARLGDSESVAVGQECLAIGNAMGYGQSVTRGIISALDREVTVQDQTSGQTITNNLLQTDAAINPGNSGGALIDANGAVIGINSVKYSDTSVEGMGYAIPINDVKPVVNKFIYQEKVADSEKAFLGISGIEVSSSANENYGIPQGLCLTKVGEGSAADKAGFEVGDIITKFNGRKISSMEEISEEIEYLSAGSTVDVTIARKADGYKESEISVTLGSRDDEMTASKPSETEQEPDEPDDITNTPDNNPEHRNDANDMEWPFGFFGF